ncbi:MAG: VWA domain-containing protein [Hyphomicrobiaceae bacterium]
MEKTEFAIATEIFLDLLLIRLQCYEGLDEVKVKVKALCAWKYGKQLPYTQVLKDRISQVNSYRRTTIIILGDARSNYANPRTEVMAWLSHRTRRVVWLNPEPEAIWGIGDSEMLRYRCCCDLVRIVRTLDDLEGAIGNILSLAIRR